MVKLACALISALQENPLLTNQGSNWTEYRFWAPTASCLDIPFFYDPDSSPLLFRNSLNCICMGSIVSCIETARLYHSVSLPKAEWPRRNMLRGTWSHLSSSSLSGDASKGRQQSFVPSIEGCCDPTRLANGCPSCPNSAAASSMSKTSPTI